MKNPTEKNKELRVAELTLESALEKRSDDFIAGLLPELSRDEINNRKLRPLRGSLDRAFQDLVGRLVESGNYATLKDLALGLGPEKDKENIFRALLHHYEKRSEKPELTAENRESLERAFATLPGLEGDKERILGQLQQDYEKHLRVNDASNRKARESLQPIILAAAEQINLKHPYESEYVGGEIELVHNTSFEMALRGLDLPVPKTDRYQIDFGSRLRHPFMALSGELVRVPVK